MNTAKKFTVLDIITVGFIVACFARPAQAGWSGAMNGIGYGQATVNVRAYDTLASKTRYVSTTNMVSPSAAITITTGYVFGALLPPDASPATVAKVKGLPGYIWQATTVGSDGDSTDNVELENRITITASDCASLEMETSAAVNEVTKSGTINVNVVATAGTAIWTRGFEILSGQIPPEDDPNTPDTNEFIEFLKTHGQLRFDVLNVGPLNLPGDCGGISCDSIRIPFSYETEISNLYFVSDGVAKSLPLVIECPNDIVVDCQQPVTYPETVLVGGCGDIAVSINPPAPAGGSFPPGYFSLGITPVTVTATDKDGNTKSCTFNVIVTDSTAPVITATGTPSDGKLGLNPTAAQIEAALGTATAADNCEVGTPTAQTGSVIADDCSRSRTRTWNVTDAAGNPATAVSRTVTWTADTTPPVIPTLPTVTGSCGASVTITAPTTTDNCAGTVTGTTSEPLTYSTPGTNLVRWTFSDGNGNSSTANQIVIVPSLKFMGFHSPIGTVSNTCTTAKSANWGRTLPIKFDMKCGTSYVTGGTPPVVTIQRMKNCQSYGSPLIVNAVYQNYWHYNWNTDGCGKGEIYKITVTMPGGQQPYVFVKAK